MDGDTSAVPHRHPVVFYHRCNRSPPASPCTASSHAALDAADKRRVPQAATGVSETGNRAVVAEARELVLQGLGERGSLDQGVLGSLPGELGVEVFGIEGIGLRSKVYCQR